MPQPAVNEHVMKENAEETHHDDEETGVESMSVTSTAQHVYADTTAQHVRDTGKEEAALSH